MKNLFEFATAVLHGKKQNAAEVLNRIPELTEQAWKLLMAGQLSLLPEEYPQPVSATVFPDRPHLQDPRDMPRRKLTTLKGKIAFFHAIAHIEYMAIFLAWDMLYRFRGMPERFYRDWLVVAYEESRHFLLLREKLQGLGADYGDLPAHQGLWDVASDTADDVLARLALVPRFMEAHGLDVNSVMISKFEAMQDYDSVSLLSRILQDEIGHVERGSFWFRHICAQRGIEPEDTWRQLVTERLKGSPGRTINRKLRKQAGFSDNELDWLASL